MLNKINHTQISNDYLDKWMSKLQSSSTLVFLAIARKTIGWHKDNDQISQTQIMKLTGLSKNSVKAGIKELLKNEIITMARTGTGKNIISNFEINYFNISKNDIINDDIISKNDIIAENNISKIDTTKESNINKEYKEIGHSPLPLKRIEKPAGIISGYSVFEEISPTPHSAPPPSPKKFLSPDLEIVKKHWQEKHYKSNPRTFFNYYESNGWMVGKNKMKKWEAAAAMWESRNISDSKPSPYKTLNEEKY